jgi:hypothetical protein
VRFDDHQQGWPDGRLGVGTVSPANAKVAIRLQRQGNAVALAGVENAFSRGWSGRPRAHRANRPHARGDIGEVAAGRFRSASHGAGTFIGIGRLPAIGQCEAVKLGFLQRFGLLWRGRSSLQRWEFLRHLRNSVISGHIDRDVEGYRPEKGQLDREGEEVEDRIYNVKDSDRTLVLDERTKLLARKVTELLKQSGDRFQKTIVFCVDQEHAARMRQAPINENGDLVAENNRYIMRITGGGP